MAPYWHSAPLSPLPISPRPDTTFPVLDKTPGDDPFVRDEFQNGEFCIDASCRIPPLIAFQPSSNLQGKN